MLSNYTKQLIEAHLESGQCAFALHDSLIEDGYPNIAEWMLAAGFLAPVSLFAMNEYQIERDEVAIRDWPENQAQLKAMKKTRQNKAPLTAS